ncbi:Uncharacterised protein [Mycobacteroides abscessus subsp. abscessus]|nr:Uncharacterised protein [Mycobacteroides abscessus subsp. abscessus]
MQFDGAYGPKPNAPNAMFGSANWTGSKSRFIVGRYGPGSGILGVRKAATSLRKNSRYSSLLRLALRSVPGSGETSPRIPFQLTNNPRLGTMKLFCCRKPTIA